MIKCIPGETVILCSDTSDTTAIRKVTFSKKMAAFDEVSFVCEVVINGGKELVYISDIYPEDMMDELIEVVTTRERLKKELQDSTRLVYQLRNKITLRG